MPALFIDMLTAKLAKFDYREAKGAAQLPVFDDLVRKVASYNNRIFLVTTQDEHQAGQTYELHTYVYARLDDDRWHYFKITRTPEWTAIEHQGLVPQANFKGWSSVNVRAPTLKHTLGPGCSVFEGCKIAVKYNSINIRKESVSLMNIKWLLYIIKKSDAVDGVVFNKLVPLLMSLDVAPPRSRARSSVAPSQGVRGIHSANALTRPSKKTLTARTRHSN